MFVFVFVVPPSVPLLFRRLFCSSSSYFSLLLFLLFLLQALLHLIHLVSFPQNYRVLNVLQCMHRFQNSEIAINNRAR